MDSEKFFDNFETIANAPGGIARLRELILDLALHGKLVPQIFDEESIVIKTADGAFEIPNSWNWVKVDSVTDFINGFAFKSEEYHHDGIGIVRMSDLKLGQIAVHGMKRVPDKYLAILDENLRVSPGDLVIGMSGSIGKPCFNLTDEVFLLNQRVGKFVPHSVNKSYLAIVLQTLENSFLEMSAGSGIKNLSTKQIKDAVLPLPPVLEQERIVSKVNELLTLCDELETAQDQRNSIRTATRKSAIDLVSTATTSEELNTAWKRISSNWTTIAETPETVDSLKMVILDLAVRGRLVLHENSDDSAIELVNKSISGGKNKSVSEQLTPSKSLFEIPDHWVWASVASMCDTQTGTTPKVLGEDESDSERIQYVTAADMINFRAVENNFVPLTTAKRAGRLVTENSVLFVGIGATIGKTCLLNSPATFNQQIHAATPRKMNAEYLSLVLASGYFQQICRDRTNATAIPILNKSKWEAIGIPIPPLKEQVRISERCRELFALCDELEFSLIKRDELAKKIAASLTNQAAA